MLESLAERNVFLIFYPARSARPLEQVKQQTPPFSEIGHCILGNHVTHIILSDQPFIKRTLAIFTLCSRLADFHFSPLKRTQNQNARIIHTIRKTENGLDKPDHIRNTSKEGPNRPGQQNEMGQDNPDHVRR
jgi:hypothetical protein